MESLRPLVDDLEISNDDVLFRVVRPDVIDFGPPPVARSNAFQQYSTQRAAEFGIAGPCFSVALRSIWLEERASVDDLLAKFDRTYGIVAMSVGGVRGLARTTGQPQPQGVMGDPTDEPWHAVVWDLSGAGRSKPAEKALSLLATDWLHLPDRSFSG